MGQQINQMIDRLIPQMQQFWALIATIITLIGLTLLIVALVRRIKRTNHAGHTGKGLDSALFIAGVVLVSAYAMLDTLAMTVFQEASMNSLSYEPPESIGQKYIIIAVYIIQTVGLCGFARGWIIINKAFTWGATHIIGGFLAVNIVAALKSLGLTFGGAIQDAVQITIGG